MRYTATLKGDKSNSSLIASKIDHQGDSDGVYESNVIFQEDGIYYV
ncbi:hypothetical protein [Brevibacillus laterosporus]|nr:hypothetical protein [Brevibacillus laterosporus]